MKKHDDYNIELLWYLGTILFKDNKKGRETLNIFRKLYKLINKGHPYYANINIYLGHLYSEMDNINLAKIHYKNAILDPVTSDKEKNEAKKYLEGLHHL